MLATGLSLLAEAAKGRQNDITAMAVTRQSGWSITAIVVSSTVPTISVIKSSMTLLTTTLVARSGLITKNAT